MPEDSSPVCAKTGYGTRQSVWLESLPCSLAMHVTWDRPVVYFELLLLQ